MSECVSGFGDGGGDCDGGCECKTCACIDMQRVQTLSETVVGCMGEMVATVQRNSHLMDILDFSLTGSLTH